MNSIRKEILETLREMETYIEGFSERSPHALVDKLAVLSKHSASRSSDKFQGLVAAISASQAPFDRDDYDRLFAMYEAEESILEFDSASATTSADLPTFKLGSDDKAKLLKTCETMRKIVWNIETFDLPHRNRLLKRIAAMEIEINKEKGLFDVILGGVNDIGEAAGKFGTDVKPLTDRINEVFKITRKASKEYDQLPAPDEVKQLPPPEDPEE